jgi:PAS domain S-box-containing protein
MADNSSRQYGSRDQPAAGPPAQEYGGTLDESAPLGDPARFVRWARCGGLFVLAMSLLALLGWLSGRMLLASLGSEYIPMAPSTALCYCLLALPLVFLPQAPPSRTRRLLMTVVPVAAVLAALYLLSQFYMGLTADVERVLVSSPETFGPVLTGRMSPLTAWGILVAGVGLSLLAWRNHRPAFAHAAGALGVAAALESLVVVLGYVYASPFLYGADIIPMAFTTALCLGVLSLSLILAAGPEAFPLRLLTDGSMRARLLRAFLPIPPAVIVVEGLLFRMLPMGNPALQAALLVLLTSAALIGMVYYIASTTGQRLERAIALRQEAERQLDAQRLELEEKAALLDLANSAIFSRGMDQTIRYWNKGAENVFGYGREEALGQNVASLLCPQYTQSTADIEHVLLARDVWEGEGTFTRKDGSRITLLSRWALQRDPAGLPRAVLKVNIDLSALKAAGNKLQEQLDRTQLLNDIARAIAERHDIESILRVVMTQLENHLPIAFGGVFMMEGQADMIRVAARGPRSREFARILGTEEGKTIPVDSRMMRDALNGNTIHIDDLSLIEDILATRYTKVGLRTAVLVPMLVESRVQGVVTALREAPGAFSGDDVRFLQQLTEQVAVALQEARQYMALERAYDELRKTQDTMLQQERLRALGQMAGGITHDINNALSPIVGYSDLLLTTEEGISEEGRSFIENIRVAGYDIRNIISRLREFYRPKDHSEIHVSVNLNQLVKQVIELTSPRWKDTAQQRLITIRIEADLAETPCVVMGAESEIREALMNLVINSLDALQEDGVITLRTSTNESGALLEVTDTGMGMDEETRRQCLEPFFTTKGDRGTGLGLGMAFGVMQRHHGRIEIESTPRQGTTVRMHFPALSLLQAEPEEAASHGDMPALHILYVDDEPHLRELVKRMLEVDRHDVTTADGGQAGIEAVRKASEEGQPFDVVISDLGMPYVGGRQVARAVRADFPGIPIILLTGWGNRLNAEGALPDNVDLVLSKPPKLEELRAALHGIWKASGSGG